MSTPPNPTPGPRPVPPPTDKPDAEAKPVAPANAPAKAKPTGAKPGTPARPGPPGAKPGAGSAPAAAAETRPAVSLARPRRRHALILISFLVMVAGPMAVSAWYLWVRAVDQYASQVGFSVRTEEANSAIELLGGITNLSGSSSSDTDILYEFLQSQQLVIRLDEALDLRAIWSRPDPDLDPIFTYHAPGTIEDLVDHWGRMVRIYYDSGTSLIDLEVRAFTAEEAQSIAQMIFEESSTMINALSAIAREDTIGYAREELEQAQDRLAEARVTLAEWRNANQIIDPTVDTQGQMGLVTNLQAQLAEALIQLDLLQETARQNDPRIAQAERLIAVIETRIAAERAVLGAADDGRTGIADLVGEYERLLVDQEFAETAYTTSLAAFDSARNEARRQSRYLAAHIRPTLAERAQYPDRPMTLAVITLFAFLIWSVVVLLAYSLRDRR